MKKRLIKIPSLLSLGISRGEGVDYQQAGRARRLKIGAKRGSDGYFFHRYVKNPNIPTRYYEVWCSPKRFKAIREILRLSSQRQYHKNPAYHYRHVRSWANRNRKRVRELGRQNKRKMILSLDWSDYLLLAARTSCVSKGFSFPQIDKTYIKNLVRKSRYKCFWTRVRVDLVAHGNKSNPWKVSLDRVNNNKGYIKGNLKVVSWGANRMRGNMPLNKFRHFLGYVGVKKWRRNRDSQKREPKYSKSWSSRLYNSTRWRCRRAGFGKPDFSREFLDKLKEKQGGKCALSGIFMDFTSQSDSRNPFKASVDRINNNAHYTKNNIRLVCAALNIGRGECDDKKYTQYLKEAGIFAKG